MNASIADRILCLAVVSVMGCGQKSSKDVSRPDSAANALPLLNSIDKASVELEAQKLSPGIVRWVNVPDLPKDLALMESVFWEPDDTLSLRQMIAASSNLQKASVLEIGTGSGLVSLCCLKAGASRVIATDLNPIAVQNALFNAREMGFADRMGVRLVPRRSPGAWTVIEPDARFDLIISNPPWENRKPVSVEEFALYDPDFLLLKSLVTGARTRLKPNGRMWLAYGCVTAIRCIQDVAAVEKLNCKLLDDRDINALPELFLPGMLVEITVP